MKFKFKDKKSPILITRNKEYSITLFDHIVYFDNNNNWNNVEYISYISTDILNYWENIININQLTTIDEIQKIIINNIPTTLYITKGDTDSVVLSLILTYINCYNYIINKYLDSNKDDVDISKYLIELNDIINTEDYLDNYEKISSLDFSSCYQFVIDILKNIKMIGKETNCINYDNSISKSIELDDKYENRYIYFLDTFNDIFIESNDKFFKNVDICVVNISDVHNPLLKKYNIPTLDELYKNNYIYDLLYTKLSNIVNSSSFVKDYHNREEVINLINDISPKIDSLIKVSQLQCNYLITTNVNSSEIEGNEEKIDNISIPTSLTPTHISNLINGVVYNNIHSKHLSIYINTIQPIKLFDWRNEYVELVNSINSLVDKEDISRNELLDLIYSRVYNLINYHMLTLLQNPIEREILVNYMNNNFVLHHLTINPNILILQQELDGYDINNKSIKYDVYINNK